MQREAMLDQVMHPDTPWDILVIGGGASGLGAGVDAASRGYRTLLLEARDFAQGTSSRSTKLIHGGVRYLQQGNLALVIEALHERGLLLQNAPHLVRHQSFVVPNYTWWEGPFYGIGMKLYDTLAGKLGLGPSRWLSREETMSLIPTLEPEGLRGGVIYCDGQFDDARLAVVLAQTMVDMGGVALNYMPVTALIKRNGLVQGVLARDGESGREIEILARVVVNATGPFVDHIRLMDDTAAPSLIAPSQGVHIVLDRVFLPSDSAIMVPHTDDGRVLFAVPWQGRVIVGTTDTPLAVAAIEPQAQSGEIDFLLRHAARYLTRDPQRADVLSLFAGIRPLVQSDGSHHTAALARDHHLVVSHSGLVTIAGGKWTTYRKMGEDTVNQAAVVGGLQPRACRTPYLNLHGWGNPLTSEDSLAAYGRDGPSIRELIRRDPELEKTLHPDLSCYCEAQVVWAVRQEMARSVEDVLSRRTRALIIDARASMVAAPRVACLMARELGRDEQWIQKELAAFEALARRYRLD